MLAALLALALAAPGPRKPVSLHAVTATRITFDFQTARAVRTNIVVSPYSGNRLADVHVYASGTVKTVDHRVEITGLKPDTEYRYRVATPDSPRAFEGHFWTAPRPGSKAPFTFAVVGDSRDHQAWAKVARAVAAAHPRFVLTTGDCIEGGNSAPAWRDYYRAGAGLFADTPAFGVRGNHDLGSQFGAFNPAPAAALGPSTYSFRYGSAGFLALDSNRPNDPKQLAFAAHALKAMHGGPIFVFQHHPFYSCGIHGGSRRLRQAFQHLFETAQVTIDFAGHDHDLIAWKPIGGVRYLVSGGGGAPLYPLHGCGDARFARRSYGYVLVKVAGKAVHATFYDAQGLPLYALRPSGTLPQKRP